jgi:CheY-like chemotaxis protein
MHPGIEPGSYVLLTVSDTGSGMSDEVKLHLFEPYFTTKEESKGTGLGLPIVRGIIRQHGGHVEVVSTLGQGSTFLIYLPEADVAAAPVSDEHASEEAYRGTETILLVGDVPELRSALRQLLEVSGYQVIEASTGTEALATMEARRFQIDLLLTEMALSQLNGPQLAEALQIKHPKLKTLFLSGYEDDEQILGGSAWQALDILRKPFGPDELVRRVRRALDSPGTGAPPGHPLGSPHGQKIANGTRVSES